MKRQSISLAVSLLLLAFVSSAQQAPPVIQWQKSLGGSKVDKSYTVIRTLDNGYLVVGESFSNDGDVTGHHGSTDSSDAWVVKLDTAGNIQWQHSYGGTHHDRFVDALQASNGDFICVGTSESNNGDVSGLHNFDSLGNYVANSDVWVMRISSAGQIKWSKLFGGTYTEDGQVIRKASDGGGYVIAGNAKSVDYDVKGNHGYMDVWLLKINESGQLQWQKSYGVSNNEFATDLTVKNDGTYLISGYTTATGLGGCQVIYSMYNSIAIAVSASGNVIWQNIYGLACGNPGPSEYRANLIEMPSGQLFSIGNFIYASTENFPSWRFGRLNPADGSGTLYTMRGDLGSGYMYVPVQDGPHKNRLLPDSTIISCTPIFNPGNTSGSADGSLSLINTKPFSGPNDNIFFYRKLYGGSNTDRFGGIEVIDEQQFIAAGYSNSNNGDVSGNHGDYDCWVVKFSARNKIKGKVFVDNNSNGIKDAAESYANNFYVESSKNGLVIANTTDESGNFLNTVDTGTYTTTVKLKKPYYNIAPASQQTTFTQLNKSDSFDFALSPVPGKSDLQLSVQSLNLLRPGFKGQYRVNYLNAGTTSISNTRLQFIKPPKMDYMSAVPSPAQVKGDTIVWNLGTLAPLGSSFIIVTLQAQPLPGVDIGDRLSFVAEIDPMNGDETPADNRDTVWQVARGSFDPNNKTENHDGILYAKQLDNFQSFNYTVQFQNTGADTAFGITIRDTLSDKLDPASLEIVSASHPYTFALKNNKYCTWTFQNIKLVDSVTNEQFSHGHISYRIKPKTALSLGDTVFNSASIYFDFNPGVITNNQRTIVLPNLPAAPVLSGLKTSYCGNEGIQKGKVKNLPVAGSGTIVNVRIDATILFISPDSTFSFDVGIIPAGSHKLTIVFSNNSGKDSIVNSFVIGAPGTPDVNLSSNITTVTNLIDPVVITATNASGGGNAPKYVFAKDKNFANILQAEGTSNTLTIQPNTFTVGSNWIYVSMKTSDTCYTAQTNIDSIKIERSTVTGLIDVDFPGQPINIYPNPFTHGINISGLNAGKTYVISINNASGQKVYSQQFSNNQTISIHKAELQSGHYWLGIYDVKNHRPIGTLAIMKQ